MSDEFEGPDKSKHPHVFEAEISKRRTGDDTFEW